MPRSGWSQQQCACGRENRARVAISIQASTLGIVPRLKSATQTIYMCAGCMKQAKRPTRRQVFDAVSAATKIIAAVYSQKEKTK